MPHLKPEGNFSMYTSEEAEREHAEWLNELVRSTHADLLARYLDLSERYGQLAAKLDSRNMWLFVVSVVLAMFVSVYWLGIPLSNPRDW
jgi:hypothetical protein